jgi:hypothetical protein
MWKALPLVLSAICLNDAACAGEYVRIKRPPPSALEAARIASEMVMNDSLLQKGDMVVTDRGLLVFRGLAPDGITNEFTPVPSPVDIGKPGK